MQVAEVPTLNIPPRPPVTTWEWAPEWDQSAVAAQSRLTASAKHLFEVFKKMAPADFDGVRCEPLVMRDDGPDQIIGAQFTVTYYPNYLGFFIGDIWVDSRAVDLMAKYVDRLKKEFALARLHRFRQLACLPMLCHAHYWVHPTALRERIEAEEVVRQEILTWNERRLRQIRDKFGLETTDATNALSVDLGLPAYTDER